MTKPIIVPADIYDCHELVSEAYGGVGKVLAFEGPGVPYCIIGQRNFALFAARDLNIYQYLDYEMVESLLPKLDKQTFNEFYNWDKNDDVERAYQGITGKDRMPWPEYCKARNIVRGD